MSFDVIAFDAGLPSEGASSSSSKPLAGPPTKKAKRPTLDEILSQVASSSNDNALAVAPSVVSYEQVPIKPYVFLDSLQDGTFQLTNVFTREKVILHGEWSLHVADDNVDGCLATVVDDAVSTPMLSNY